MTDEVRLAREGDVAILTLSNPGRLNAMTRAMWRGLRGHARVLAADGTLRCVLVRGEGGAFCAGGDISEYPDFRFHEPSLRGFHEDEVWGALDALLALPVPVVAAIEGACMGAGVEIASCCDIRLAGESASFGAPIARLGFPMAPREAALVRRALGDTLARDMLMAAGVHRAARLLSAGFLLEVLPDGAVQDAARAHAARVAALAPLAARAHKRLFATFDREGAGALAALLPSAYDYADTPEHREGIDAFLAKRPPAF